MPKRTKRTKRTTAYVSTWQIAEHLGRTQKNVRELMRRGQLPGRRIGGRWVMTGEEWQKFLTI